MPTGLKSPALDEALGARPPRSLLELIRFRHFRHFLVLPLASADVAHPSLRGALSLGRGVAAGFFLLAFGYLANTVGDRDMDLDPAKNPLAARAPIDDRRIEVLLAILAISTLLLAGTGPLLVVAAAACGLISGWAYSLGPRLKTRPVIGTLLNATNFAPLLLLGMDRSSPPARLTFLVPAFVALLLQNQLLHEAADAAEDRGGGVRTTFLAIGASGAAVLAALCGAALLWITLRLLTERALPLAFALHTAPHLLVFPALLAVAGRSPACMAGARVAQRWAAAASGALLVLLEL